MLRVSHLKGLVISTLVLLQMLLNSNFLEPEKNIESRKESQMKKKSRKKLMEKSPMNKSHKEKSHKEKSHKEKKSYGN